MGVLAVIICGFLGIVVACKKNFLESWIFLVNLAMATYLAIFLTPLIIPLLEQVPLARELKVGGGALVLTFCLTWLLQKITEQVAPESGLDISIPPLANKIASMAAGFLCGILLVALFLFVLVKLPFAASFSCRNDLEKSAQAVLLRNIKTINAFSSQTLSGNGQKALQQMMILPAPPAPPESQPAASQSTESKSAKSKSKNHSSKVHFTKGVKSTSAKHTKESRVFIGEAPEEVPSDKRSPQGQVVTEKSAKENGIFIGEAPEEVPSAKRPEKGQAVTEKANGIFIGDATEEALSAKRSPQGQAVRGKAVKKNDVFIGDSPRDTPAVKPPVTKKSSVGLSAPVADSGVFIGDDPEKSAVKPSTQQRTSAPASTSEADSGVFIGDDSKEKQSASTAKIDSAEVKTPARQNSSGMNFLSLESSISEK